MRTVVLVPYRPDNGRRDELWVFVKDWLQAHHDWEIIEGTSPDGPFNRGAAINDAARKAGEWDVAVVSDADNITDPEMLERAVVQAYEGDSCVFPFRTYLYLDEFSTDRLLAGQSWFVAPITQQWGVIWQHCSGVQAISRTAYDQVGGFPEMEGWGHEDCVMGQMIQAFTNGIEHLPGSAYHLHHGDYISPERKLYGEINREVLADVMALSVVPDQLRAYLQEGGHPVP